VHSLRCWQPLWRVEACLEFEGKRVLLYEDLPVEAIVVGTIDPIEGPLEIPIVGAAAIHITFPLSL